MVLGYVVMCRSNSRHLFQSAASVGPYMVPLFPLLDDNVVLREACAGDNICPIREPALVILRWRRTLTAGLALSYIIRLARESYSSRPADGAVGGW